MSLEQIGLNLKLGVRNKVIEDMHPPSGAMKTRGKIIYSGELYCYEVPAHRLGKQKIVIRKGPNAVLVDEFYRESDICQ